MENEARIPQIWGGVEDYNLIWGKVDYKGKVILDVGCDWGSTTDFFLQKGAKLVVGVDINKEWIKKFKEFRKKYNLSCYCVRIDMSDFKVWEYLIDLFEPDVVKSDCEGAEEFLFQISDEVFSTVPEYIIEYHTKEICSIIKNKCELCGYKIIDINTWGGENVGIIYIRKGT